MFNWPNFNAVEMHAIVNQYIMFLILVQHLKGFYIRLLRYDSLLAYNSNILSSLEKFPQESEDTVYVTHNNGT